MYFPFIASCPNSVLKQFYFQSLAVFEKIESIGRLEGHSRQGHFIQIELVCKSSVVAVEDDSGGTLKRNSPACTRINEVRPGLPRPFTAHIKCACAVYCKVVLARMMEVKQKMRLKSLEAHFLPSSAHLFHHSSHYDDTCSVAPFFGHAALTSECIVRCGASSWRSMLLPPKRC